MAPGFHVEIANNLASLAVVVGAVGRLRWKGKVLTIP